MLLQQPLCVCHLQELLDLPQVNVSQHLAYLRKNGLVEFTSGTNMESVPTAIAGCLAR